MVRFTSWGSAALWLGAGAVAFGAMLLAPSERTVMGQLPPLAAKARDQRLLTLPQELPAERTLAFVVYGPEQKAEVLSWIDGLRLHQDASIPWLKVRVLGPQEVARASHASAVAYRPEQLLSVSTNAGQLAQAMVLPDTSHLHVVVLGRDGQVLAKAQGPYDEEKAQALLETLRAD